MDYISKQCPKCHKQLQIPSDLETCICMYCGEPFPVNEEILTDTRLPNQQAIQTSYQETLANTAKLVENYDKLVPRFTRDQYIPSFEEYTKKAEGILSSAQNYASVSEENLKKVVQDITLELLNAINKNISETKGSLISPTKARTIDQSRFFMAIYLIPMIKYLNYNYSDALVDNIIREWINIFPKYEFKKAGYEELKAGFDRKGFCFITTAVCETLGKSDECYELTSFRKFRDEYMSTTSEGQSVVSEYYHIAPVIVSYINMGANCQEKYRAIWESYLQPCLGDIENSHFEECENRYVTMVHNLKKELPFEIIQE